MAPTVDNLVVGLQTNNTVKLGPYGTVEASCTELGFTEGGIEFTNAKEIFEQTADQYIGVLGVKKIKERPTVKFAISEATLDNMRLAWNLEAARLVGNVLSWGGASAVTYMTLFLNVNSPGGGTRKYEVLKVVPIGTGMHKYTREGGTLIEFEFLVLQDTSATTDEQCCIMTDSGVDTTAPTIAMTTPADNGTVVKEAPSTVLLTITEAGTMDENSIKYGDDANATIMITNTTVLATPVLVAGTIVYDATAKTILFTPTVNWVASETFQVMVTTGLRDMAGNNLAAMFLGNFSATA